MNIWIIEAFGGPVAGAITEQKAQDWIKLLSANMEPEKIQAAEFKIHKIQLIGLQFDPDLEVKEVIND